MGGRHHPRRKVGRPVVTMCHPCPGQMCRVCDDDPAIPHGRNPLVTNQEPGAPEPLTSDEERGLRAMLSDAEVAHVGASYVRRLFATLDRERAPLSAGTSIEVWRLGEHAPDNEFDAAIGETPCIICGERWPCEPYRFLMELASEGQRRHAALSHPESDTREDADLEAWRQFTMDLADGKVSEKPNGLVREAFAYAWNAAHPESDTRGLDARKVHAILCDGTFDHEPGTDSHCFDFVRRYNESASPDLSIDREGRCHRPLGVGAFCDEHMVDWPEDGDPLRCPEAALRGTTQPEPTDPMCAVHTFVRLRDCEVHRPEPGL